MTGMGGDPAAAKTTSNGDDPTTAKTSDGGNPATAKTTSDGDDPATAKTFAAGDPATAKTTSALGNMAATDSGYVPGKNRGLAVDSNGKYSRSKIYYEE